MELCHKTKDNSIKNLGANPKVFFAFLTVIIYNSRENFYLPLLWKKQINP